MLSGDITTLTPVVLLYTYEHNSKSIPHELLTVKFLDKADETYGYI